MSTATMSATPAIIDDPAIPYQPRYLEASTWLSGCGPCMSGWLLNSQGEWEECDCVADLGEPPVEEPPVLDPLAA